MAGCGGGVVTFLTALAWLGGIIAVIVGLLFIALCIYLGRAAVQERQLSRLEAEATEAKLQSSRTEFVPRMLPPWQPTDEHLRDPRERDRPEPPSSPAS